MFRQGIAVALVIGAATAAAQGKVKAKPLGDVTVKTDIGDVVVKTNVGDAIVKTNIDAVIASSLYDYVTIQGPQGTPAPKKPPATRPPREPREEWFPLVPGWPEPAMPPLPMEPMVPPTPAMPPLPMEPMVPPTPMMPPMPAMPAEPMMPPPQGGEWRMQHFEPPHFEPFHFEMPPFEAPHFEFSFNRHEFPMTMPGPAVQGDMADSLWRQGRELVNRGEYRRAATTLAAIPQRYPNSALVGDALYWQAHSLYRIGGTADLQQALTALETLMSKYPNARSQPDAKPLATRIQGALAARGDARAKEALAKEAAAQGQSASCDREEQAVRAEALSALVRTNPDDMSSLMRSVLARKDECSVQLRKTAVYLVGNKRDAQAGSVLIGVAKSDPSIDVRVDAINWLSRIDSDEAVAALGDLTKAEEDERIQRAAVRALVNHPRPAARQQVRALVERADAPERLRAEALSAFTSERATTEDIAWLRSVYTKLDNPRLKRSALASIVRVSGPETDQWLMTIVRNEDEPGEVRATALRRIGQTMSIAEIGKMYDGASSRSLREQLISILGNRKEPEATDKLIDIAKNGTDPNLRTRAINVLSEKNDPRTRQLLLELINK